MSSWPRPPKITSRRRCPRCSPRRRSRAVGRGHDVEVADVVADEARPRRRRSRRACAMRRRARSPAKAPSIPPSPWTTSLPIWPKSMSLRLAAGEVVVAEAARAGGAAVDRERVELVGVGEVVVEGDEVLGPPRRAVDVAAVPLSESRYGSDAVDEQQRRSCPRRPGCRSRTRSAGRCGCRAACRRAPGSGRSSCRRAGVVGQRRNCGSTTRRSRNALSPKTMSSCLVAVRHVVAGAGDDRCRGRGCRRSRRRRRSGTRATRSRGSTRARVVWIFCSRGSGWFGVGDLLDDRAVVAEDHVVVGALRPAQRPCPRLRRRSRRGRRPCCRRPATAPA